MFLVSSLGPYVCACVVERRMVLAPPAATVAPAASLRKFRREVRCQSILLLLGVARVARDAGTRRRLRRQLGSPVLGRIAQRANRSRLARGRRDGRTPGPCTGADRACSRGPSARAAPGGFPTRAARPCAGR